MIGIETPEPRPPAAWRGKYSETRLSGVCFSAWFYLDASFRIAVFHLHPPCNSSALIFGFVDTALTQRWLEPVTYRRQCIVHGENPRITVMSTAD